MVEFTGTDRCDGAPLATSESLRAAKLVLLRNSKWRHPFYWSPFVRSVPRSLREVRIDFFSPVLISLISPVSPRQIRFNGS